MIKIRVTKKFVDRFTKEMRELGQIYEYSDERANYIVEQGYGEKVDSMPKIETPHDIVSDEITE